MNATALKKQEFKPGDRIFREGEAGNHIYIIESGLVELAKGVAGDEHVVVANVGKGEMIGEMALIDNQPRSVTARVVEPTVVMVLERGEFEARLKRSDPVIARILKIFTQRLRSETRLRAERTTVIR